MARRFRRWALVLLAILVAWVVVVRVALFETLRVTSGSMEPLLHGAASGGDEILVAKPWWKLFEPRRFDLVVFERSGEEARSDERVVVKRVAALGGEAVRIDGGELLVRGHDGVERPIVKEYAEFRPLLVPLWREPGGEHAAAGLLLEERRGDGREHGLEHGSEERSVTYDDGWLAADGTRQPGHHAVADVLFRIDLLLEEESTSVRFNFSAAKQSFAIQIEPLAGRYAVTIDRQCEGEPHRVVCAPGAAVAVGKSRCIELWHIDTWVGVAIDGEVALTVGATEPKGVLDARGPVHDVKLEVQGGRATRRGFSVWRDLFFTRPTDAPNAVGDTPFEVPVGSLFLLGDASFQSIDSRYYGAVPIAALRGRPLWVTGPSGRRRALW